MGWGGLDGRACCGEFFASGMGFALLPRPVRGVVKTMKQEPLFGQGVWMTPIVLAICGIAAALCALMLT